MIIFMFYAPPIMAFLLYGFLAITSGLGSVSPMAWLYSISLFAVAILLSKKKWWGALIGFFIGLLLIWMSFQYTGQTINIERPIGFALCLFYVICGVILSKRKNDK